MRVPEVQGGSIRPLAWGACFTSFSLAAIPKDLQEKENRQTKIYKYIYIYIYVNIYIYIQRYIYI